jgi:hypothetical protein
VKVIIITINGTYTSARFEKLILDFMQKYYASLYFHFKLELLEKKMYQKDSGY